MQKIKEFFKKHWLIISGVVGLFFYAIFQRSKRLDAEANNSIIAADVKDQDLNRRIEENKEKSEELDKELEKISEQEQAAKEASKDMSEEEKIDFWNKKLGK